MKHVYKNLLISLQHKWFIPWLLLWACLLSLAACRPIKSNRIPIAPIIDSLTHAINLQGNWQKFDQLNQDQVQKFFSYQDLAVLGSQYWIFEVNQAVEVFVCRDTAQTETPFWLIEQGFENSHTYIKNELVTYEVWQKRFEKGPVNLGINGFDRHRFVYFVAIKPIKQSSKISLRPIYPEHQDIYPLKVGQYTYSDWDELSILSFPKTMEGAYVLPTFRGRSREAHLIKGFRTTKYPAQEQADQMLLSWIDDPKHSQYISWRTNTDIQKSQLKYWSEGLDTVVQSATTVLLKDPLLINNLAVKRHSVHLQKLQAGTRYSYQIWTDEKASEVRQFQTEAEQEDFAFAWFGDVHNDESWGEKLPNWTTKFPDVKFHLFAGDLVNTGLYRDQWDMLWHAAKPIMDRPIFAAPGNHDSQEGLPPSMFLEYLKAPNTGPKHLDQGLSYAFNYQNCLFLMLDAVGSDVAKQADWLAECLASSKQQFKVVTFHFAPFTEEGDYRDIEEHWIPLFEKYHVDLVFNGHFHFYQHVQPKPAGPHYIMSVATSVKDDKIIAPQTLGKWKNQGYLYQFVRVQPGKLVFTALDADLHIIDQFEITKI